MVREWEKDPKKKLIDRIKISGVNGREIGDRDLWRCIE